MFYKIVKEFQDFLVAPKKYRTTPSHYFIKLLQQKKLLQKYYRAFVKAQPKDPGGYETLKKILGRKDLTAFQKDWEQYVMKLRFR